MNLGFLVPSLLVLLALGACSSSGQDPSPDGGTAGDAGSGGAGGSDGGNEGGSAGTTGPGDFEPEAGCRSDGDCVDHPRGPTCFHFGADGPSTCGYPRTTVTECVVSRPMDLCCSDDDCSGGRCFVVTTQPVQCSATAGFDAANQCVADDCESDADCPSGLCTPDGYTEGRRCMPAACETDADCTEAEGGVCSVVDLGCCEEVVGGAPIRTGEVACAYPGDGCQRDADCPEGDYCVVRDGRARCSASCP